MRVAVIGTGGIGGYFGGRLAAAGHDVTFVARGAHLAAIVERGLVVESVNGDFTVSPAVATDSLTGIGKVDLVLLAVKTWQVEHVLEALRPLVGRDTAIMTTQNGVEVPHQVAAVHGQASVLPGVAKIFASIEAPGRIRHIGGPASLSFAEWDNSVSGRVRDIREALASAGVTVIVPDDIWVDLWSKFLFVVPFGMLGAATDSDLGSIRSDAGTRSLLIEAMREIEDVARAHGVDLPEGIVQGTLRFVDDQPEGGRSSLQRDLLGGRPHELDAWVGAVTRLGADVGVATPVHDVLGATLALRGAAARASS